MVSKATTHFGPAAERWTAVLILATSLVALAALPGSGGLAAAALMWIVGFALFEHAKRPARGGPR